MLDADEFNFEAVPNEQAFQENPMLATCKQSSGVLLIWRSHVLIPKHFNNNSN